MTKRRARKNANVLVVFFLNFPLRCFVIDICLKSQYILGHGTVRWRRNKSNVLNGKSLTGNSDRSFDVCQKKKKKKNGVLLISNFQGKHHLYSFFFSKEPRIQAKQAFYKTLTSTAGPFRLKGYALPSDCSDGSSCNFVHLIREVILRNRRNNKKQRDIFFFCGVRS